MSKLFQRQDLAFGGLFALAGVAAAVLMTGCGGGSSSSGTLEIDPPGPRLATVTGQLIDRATSMPAAGRIVMLQNSAYFSGKSDENGKFTISSLPATPVTFKIIEIDSTVDGTAYYDLSKYSSNPIDLGTITIDIH